MRRDTHPNELKKDMVVVEAASIDMAFVAEQHRSEGATHVLLVTTGSVASIKAPLIVQKLLSVCTVAAI